MSSDEESLCEGREKFTVERTISKEESEGPKEEQCDYFGPALPPHLLSKKDGQNKDEKKIYGPVLPDEFKLKKEGNSEAETSEPPPVEEKLIGPEIPEHLKSCQMETEELDEESGPLEDDGGDFGPSTVLMTSGDTPNYYQTIPLRNVKKESTSETSTKREEWMTELPEKKRANLGLFPRHFKSRVLSDKEGDSSVWTDTPSDKIKKKSKGQDHSEALKAKRLEERDKEMEKLVKKAAKKLRKKESLLEIHLKNMKKKKKKEAKKEALKGKTAPERRPFDRNVDLQIHRIDESQKRAILNKSLTLNDRFSSGQSKFL